MRQKQLDDTLFKIEMLFCKFTWVTNGNFIDLAMIQPTDEVVANNDNKDWIKLKQKIKVVKIHESLQYIKQKLYEMVLANNIMSCVMMKCKNTKNRQSKQVTNDWVVQETEKKTLNTPNVFESLLLDHKDKDTQNKQQKKADVFTKNHKKIKVRILCDRSVQIKQSNSDQQSQESSKLFGFIPLPNLCQRRNKQSKVFTKVILHLHGGGWLAMKSFSHQVYSRKWAKQIDGSIIFSVDYRLSPQNAFPDALDDCWQTYLWIINEAHKYFNIDPQQIVLTGDSAGGNMCLGVCLLALKHKVKMPDGLVLSYPALDIHFEQFSPAYVYSLVDLILPFTYMKLIVDNYVQDQRLKPESNPLISPFFLSDEILKLFPKIKIFCGEDDCLKDNCIRFTNRLVKLGCDTELTIYRAISHGYLSWDFPFAMRLVRKAILDTGTQIQKILEGK